MTLGEFKAWFEGFNESIDGAPTPEQFEKIKEKIDSVYEEPYLRAPLTSPLPVVGPPFVVGGTGEAPAGKNLPISN